MSRTFQASLISQTRRGGQIVSTSRSHLQRAKADLLASKKLVENDGMVWRP
jgi:hypothetical protein